MVFKKGQMAWNKGIPHSKETCELISKKAIGRPSKRTGLHHTEETRRKISEVEKRQYASGERTAWSKGKTGVYTQEMLYKMSETKKQRYASGETTPWNQGGHHTEETKQRISKALIGRQSPMLGRHQSDEAKRKISEANRNPSDETRRKLSESRIGVILSEEHKQKFISAGRIAVKGVPKSDEHKRKLSQSLTGKLVGEKNPFYGRTHSEESLQKISQSRIGKSMGETHPNWKGGRKIVNARKCALRQRELGFIPLNEWEAKNPDFVGHHMDKEHVIYIPHSLHDSVRHMQRNQESMGRINELVINWYVEYYGLM